MVPFKCNVHAWMNAYVGVLEHPYFAVTDASGRFSIPQLPAGHLHARGLARTSRDADAAGDGRREGNQGPHVHLQGSPDVDNGHADPYDRDACADRARRSRRQPRGADFLTLTKPRLNSLVLVTTRRRVLPGRRRPAALAATAAHDRRHGARRRRRLGAQSVLGARHRSADAAHRMRPLPDAGCIRRTRCGSACC